MMVITTPMIVYRHGDDVPGERIRETLVYEDCISQPDRNVENPDDSDLLKTQSNCKACIGLWASIVFLCGICSIQVLTCAKKIG